MWRSSASDTLNSLADRASNEEAEISFVPAEEYYKFTRAYDEAQELLKNTLETSEQWKGLAEQAAAHCEAERIKFTEAQAQYEQQITALQHQLQQSQTLVETTMKEKQQIAEENLDLLEEVESLQSASRSPSDSFPTPTEETTGTMTLPPISRSRFAYLFFTSLRSQ